MTVIINEFEIDVESTPTEDAASRENAAPPGNAPITLRDVLEQIEERDQRLSAW